MSASLSDILGACKNAVVAINNGVAAYLGVRGTQVANGVTAATVVMAGPGRLGALSVIVGAAGGVVYDSKTASITTNPICAIPATAGVYAIDMPYSNGLLIVPGAGSTVTASYATGAPIGYTG